MNSITTFNKNGPHQKSLFKKKKYFFWESLRRCLKHKRMKRLTKNKPKTTKKMVIGSYRERTTLNVNGLCVLSRFRCVWFCASPWTVAYQAPLSMEFSRQEYWSGLLFPSPEDVPNPKGSVTGLPHCRQTLYCLSLQETTWYHERNFLPWCKNIMVHVFLFFSIMGICLIYLYNS